MSNRWVLVFRDLFDKGARPRQTDKLLFLLLLVEVVRLVVEVVT